MSVLARLSIRWRITLGSLVLSALFFGAAAVVFHFQVQSILRSTTITLLSNDAVQFEASLTRNNGGSVDTPGRGQLVAVIDPDGQVQVNTLPTTLSQQLPTLLRLGPSTHSLGTGDDIYLVRNGAVATGAGTWHIITARSETASALLLDRLTQALLVAAVLLILGFGAASWLLTGAALRPVTRMRKQAEELSAHGSAEPLLVGVAKDELAALAMTLNEFILQLRQSAERERQMVSDASHELRTPIAVLKTQLELAHLNRGNAEALEAEITAAERSVERLAGLATGLLELSQLESGLPEAASSGADLAVELATSVDRARVVAASRDITVDFELLDFADSLRYAVSTSNFGRLISNLTSNAINALPSGGSLRIDLRTSGAALTLTVSDSGPGIPEEFIPIAFDRFSRPDESRSGNQGGSGLGLAIVHAIVTAAHGRITLENRATGGLRVTVTLPAIS
ncbi:MAG: sensor histidine kinase [Lacisediminihabitans sp.]